MTEKEQQIFTPLKSIHMSNNPSLNLNFISKHIHSQQSTQRSAVLPNINNIRSTYLRESLSYLYTDKQHKEKIQKKFQRANTRQIEQTQSKTIYPVGTSLNAIRFKKSDSKTIEKRSIAKIIQLPQNDKRITDSFRNKLQKYKGRNSAKAQEESIFTIKKYGQWKI